MQIDTAVLGPAAGSLVAGAALLVLPGAAVLGGARLAAARLRPAGAPGESRERLGPGDALAASVALSLAVVAVLGVVLIGLTRLSPGALALPVALLAVVGTAVVVRGAVTGLVPRGRSRGRGWLGARHLAQGAFVVAASVPLSISVLGGGYRPAHSYQWFYWGLGRQLSTAGGVPSHVLEWGREVRWQPDYLEFNLLTQGFLGLLPHVEDPLAVAVWRLPTTLLVVAAVLLALRSWFGPWAAAAGTAAFAATSFFVDTVGNNSPEALGLAFGLVAVRLAVTGVRRSRPDLVLLATTTLALDVSVHGIAAAVSGMLLVVAVLLELLAARGRGLPPRRWAAVLGVAGLAAVVVLVAQGLAVQGRSSPLGDAAKPARTAVGSDPTFDFVQYSNGKFDQPLRRDALADALGQPLPRQGIDSWHWGWLVALAVLGLVAALVRFRTTWARGVGVSAGAGLLVAGAVAWFQLRYDTYVPQHTGNARIAGYVPLLYAMWVGGGTAALGAAAARLRPGRLVPAGVASLAPAVVPGLVVAAILVASAPVTVSVMSSRSEIVGDGAAALEWMDEHLPPGSRVVSNVATRGTIEFFTHAEDPLEGRQPLIEDGAFLQASIDDLLALHAFLSDPAPGGLATVGADYLLLAPPRSLGTGLEYTEPAPRLGRAAGLEQVWSRGDVRLLRAPGTPVLVDPVGPAKSLGWQVLLALLVVGATLGGAGLVLRRLGSSVRPGEGG